MTQTHTEWIPAAQATTHLGVNERTLRKWATAGRVRRRRDEQGRACYYAADIARIAATSPTHPADADTSASSAREPKSLALEHDAKTNARSLAQHLADARARERQHLQEIHWLRGKVDRLVEAHRELRVILLRNSQALAAIHTERVLGDRAIDSATTPPAASGDDFWDTIFDGQKGRGRRQG